nr:single-stranded DNA-binding protein [Tanacetum cinerariifolium]
MGWARSTNQLPDNAGEDSSKVRRQLGSASEWDRSGWTGCDDVACRFQISNVPTVNLCTKSLLPFCMSFGIYDLRK